MATIQPLKNAQLHRPKSEAFIAFFRSQSNLRHRAINFLGAYPSNVGDGSLPARAVLCTVLTGLFSGNTPRSRKGIVVWQRTKIVLDGKRSGKGG